MKQPQVAVRKAAVLGAGVMGAQIAAHLVNCGVETILFDLPAKDGDPNGIVVKAIERLGKLDPAPLASPARAAFIQPANYDQNLALLGECDLVIEAIAERTDWKRDLYTKVAPHLGPATILASNTSGLSITSLAEALPAAVRSRFCGIHFFNPPRYMHLVELIAGPDTSPAILDGLETFLVTTLGKGVVRAKDTPNFIANRVGVFSMLATMHHAQRLGLGLDVVDALTGTLVGRPKSATFRTADVVGLDVFAHVVKTMQDGLPKDPWHSYFQVPAWIQALIDKGALGQKAQAGIYKKVAGEIQVIDPGTGAYRPSTGKADEAIVEILKTKDPVQRFTALRESTHPQAQFLWSIHRDAFHYGAVHLAEIANSARDLDLAVRWGFGWTTGPFEIWQAAGWERVAGWINDDIAAGKAMSKTPLPAWVAERSSGVHERAGSYSPTTRSLEPRSALTVYRRQPFPDRVLGEDATYGETIFETDAVRLWHTGDDIAVLSFKTKLNTVSGDVLDGILQSIEEAEKSYRALVLWQTAPPFSAGANLSKTRPSRDGAPPPSAASKLLKSWKRAAISATLKVAHTVGVADKLMAGTLAQVEDLIEKFQGATMALKYASVPTIAAVDGLALGGGCELILHSRRTVATLESYIGLVEAGVGIIPAAGGSKELALRASDDPTGKKLQGFFQNVAMATVAKSAEQAREMGYLRPTDVIVQNRFELLHVAKAQAVALSESGDRPPLEPRGFPAGGKAAIANFEAAMANMLAGGYISEHDHLVGSKLARVMSGGEVEAGSMVTEQWVLDLERKAFLELIATQKTQERIEYTLKTGKPLRN